MTKIIQRHDTAANWTAVNPVLAVGEMGVETDTSRFKFGDGTSTWSELAYTTSGSGGSGTQLTSADGTTTYSKLALGDTLAVVDETIKELNGLTQTGGTMTNDYEYTGASGASLKMTEKYNLNAADSWEFQIKYKHIGGGASPTIFGYASRSDYKTPAFVYESGSLKLYMSSNGSSWNLNSTNSELVPVVGTTYFFKVGFTGSQYYIKYNTTGWDADFTTQWTKSSTTKVYCSDYFMLMNLSLNTGKYYSSGTMYLQDTALIINGEEAWRGVKVTPGPKVLNANLDELNTKQDKLTPVDSIYIEERNIEQLTQDWYKGSEKIDTPATIASNAINGITYYPYGQQVLPQDKNIHIAFDIQVTTTTTRDSNYILVYFSKNRGYVRVRYDGGYGCNFGVYIAGSDGSYKDVVSQTGGLGNGNRLHFVFDWSNDTKIWSCVVTGTEDGITYYNQTGTANYDFTAGLTESPAITYNDYNSYYTSVITIYTDTLEIASSNDKTLVIGNSYTPSPATNSSLGIVQPDGTTITVNEAGVISGQDVKTFTGYSDTGTLVLKSINGVLQWVAEG